jgi:predicted ribosome quality control (RQC) complex YloA/Tae2 family protein
MILAGKGAKENHRLTFKLAAPHDFWLHAAGVTGAHVVLRNDTRERRPPAVALAEAAAVAAFHSEASSERQADVQWTQRKNVRKPRGASPGTVTVKRFETIRVRPGLISREPDPNS